ncbi:glycosyltransferase family A protein [Parabacteroides sp. PF5-9]|uniref:glycosyltransferase family 2 protein n=1 Tax=Parabacteroides sp. PF5-9 TaxID=1742404 RepID=UPI0024749E78|nr:glycosyltransferase family A protein [Parabacteroides sp. PF5-9]MDH6358709.1 glycosyltransferase involved in cell wall biosynthesis [Parabacteroides sp. PF5-9]
MYLSVVICTYNRGKYLPMVLDSLKKQNWPVSEYEVILINNNSPDDTDKIIQSYKADNPGFNLRYFIEYNQGISYARNRGVNESHGEIIVFIDDDETVEPHFLEAINHFFETYPDGAISAGPVIPVYEAEKPQWLSHYTMRLITGEYNKGNKIKLLSPKDYPGTGHACFRKSLFEKYGDFKTNLGRKGDSLMGAEDKDFFLRLMEGGEKCYYVPEAKIYHHIPAYKLTDEFFDKLTYAMGKSERVRTLNLSKGSFYKRVIMEGVKWGASLVLWLGYALKLQPYKGNKLILFRKNLTKGLLGYTH